MRENSAIEKTLMSSERAALPLIAFWRNFPPRRLGLEGDIEWPYISNFMLI
jgi:hypothetical protein